MALTSFALAAGMLVSAVALEEGAVPLAPQIEAVSFMQLDRAEAIASHGHPNEMWRARALRALKLRQPQRAIRYFGKAGLYADKFSQHALSLMHWHGVGTATNRAQAYVWADLAAERGYRDLLLVREKMWAGLDTKQRKQALQLGPALYATYGDDAAKPRMEWEMRKARAQITGSRVGASMDRVEFMNRGAFENLGLTPKAVYADERWSATAYWREQDREWHGRVLVRSPEQLPEPAREP